MLKKILILALALGLVACSNDEGANTSDSQTSMLSSNTTWPFMVEGVFDIVDAGGYDSSGYPGWAAGSLEIEGMEYGIGIDIGEGVVADAGIDIDSGKKYKVWLDKPHQKYGDTVYPVTKIEAL